MTMQLLHVGPVDITLAEGSYNFRLMLPIWCTTHTHCAIATFTGINCIIMYRNSGKIYLKIIQSKEISSLNVIDENFCR